MPLIKNLTMLNLKLTNVTDFNFFNVGYTFLTCQISGVGLKVLAQQKTDIGCLHSYVVSKIII